MDRAVALLVDRLAQAGLLEDTLLVLTADHGGHERSHGSDSAEDMTVPLILRGPGIRAGVTRSTGRRAILDIAPTITHLLGLATPTTGRGALLDRLFCETRARPARPCCRWGWRWRSPCLAT